MKLNELKQEKTGTYAGVKYSDKTNKLINDYIKENKIPNPTDKIHTTVLYSEKYLPDFTSQGKIDPPYIVTPGNFVIWETQPDEDGETSNCLVLKVECKQLAKRHKEIIEEHGAVDRHKEFKPHITLSYDAGDIDIKKLPKLKGELEVVNEYHQDIDENWAKKHTKKKK